MLSHIQPTWVVTRLHELRKYPFLRVETINRNSFPSGVFDSFQSFLTLVLIYSRFFEVSTLTCINIMFMAMVLRGGRRKEKNETCFAFIQWYLLAYSLCMSEVLLDEKK